MGFIFWYTFGLNHKKPFSMKNLISFFTLLLLATTTFAQFELEANYSMMAPRSNFKTFHNAQDGSGINLLGRISQEESKSIEFGLGIWSFKHSEAIGSSKVTLDLADNYNSPIQVTDFSNNGTLMISLMFGYNFEESITENWSIGAGGRALGYMLVMPDLDYRVLFPEQNGNYNYYLVRHTSQLKLDLGVMPYIYLKRKIANNFYAIARGSWLVTSSLFSDLEFDEEVTIIESSGLSETFTRTNNVNLSSINLNVGFSYTFGNNQ